jgi:predicted enzyme related to lactoylglutathione lyase
MSAAKMKNAITWFEIPVTDFDRAKKFYNQILSADIQRIDMDGVAMGFLPADEGALTGGIVEDKDRSPSSKGTLLYLNVGENLSPALERVEKAGGKVVLPKTNVGQHGYIAKIQDTEGNLIAFHSQK